MIKENTLELSASTAKSNSELDSETTKSLESHTGKRKQVDYVQLDRAARIQVPGFIGPPDTMEGREWLEKRKMFFKRREEMKVGLQNIFQNIKIK